MNCGPRTRLRQGFGGQAAFVALLCLLVPAVASAQVLTSVWYRGMPAGTPRFVDLEDIRSQGFTAVTWPLQSVAGAEELQRMAARVGLRVVVRLEPVPVTFTRTTRDDNKVDVLVERTAPAEWTTLLWRSVAHGARVVSFDAGAVEGTGFRDSSGTLRDWVPVAAAVARQLNAHATLVSSLSSGPAVTLDPPDPDLDLTLLQNARSWVIIATNASTTTGRATDTTATFPSEVPAAEWLNLFDGSMMSMLYRSTGSRWRVRLGPGEARVFVIDKR